MNKIEDRIIPKTVTRFEKTDNRCKQFWMVVSALAVISICIYFGFIKNTTKLSHWLGGTGIALVFTITIVLLCFFNHKKDSFAQEAIDAEDYNKNINQIIDTLDGETPIVRGPSELGL